jgi:hypothetical protein
VRAKLSYRACQPRGVVLPEDCAQTLAVDQTQQRVVLFGLVRFTDDHELRCGDAEICGHVVQNLHSLFTRETASWEYRDPMLHHDYQRLASGNTLLVKWARIPPSVVRRVKGGYHDADDDPKEMLGDIVFEVTPQGNIVKEWKSWQYFDPKTEIICPLDHRLEWSHCNSISLSPKGDWLLSFRRINLVAEVSARTGKFKWKLANGIATHQHDVRYVGDNRITIFDNGVHRKGVEYSRAIEIDAKSKEIVWEYQDNPPFSFYTVMGGGVEVLPNGNVLICETAKGHFFEVTRDKKVVWEYINPFFVDNPRLGGRVNLVFRAHRYGPQHPAVTGRTLHLERLANLNQLYANGLKR